MCFVRTDVCEAADVSYPEFGSLAIDFVCRPPLSLADPINPFLADVTLVMVRKCATRLSPI